MIGERVSKAQTNVVLTAALVKKALRLRLSPEEQPMETKFGRVTTLDMNGPRTTTGPHATATLNRSMRDVRSTISKKRNTKAVSAGKSKLDESIQCAIHDLRCRSTGAGCSILVTRLLQKRRRCEAPFSSH